MIIPEQYEMSENYQKFVQIIDVKNINVIKVEGGEKLNIENNFYIDIIWPISDKIIGQNILNNNSLVLKMVYQNFSILFTADIEKIAEEEILKVYKNNKNILKATILKIAHHGSKTSTIKEFLEVVKPKYALIGVGKDNKFGHPNEETINRLKNKNINVYRTDKMGEIEITIKNTIKIKPYLYKINI